MKSRKLLSLVIASVFAILLGGCETISALPKIKLAPRPTLAPITDEEVNKAPGSLWEKILNLVTNGRGGLRRLKICPA